MIQGERIAGKGKCRTVYNRLLLLVTVFYFLFLAGNAAQAQIFTRDSTITNTAMIYCDNIINGVGPFQVLYPFIQCMTNYVSPTSPDNGFIPATTIAFMNTLVPPAGGGYFRVALTGMATLLIVLFGYKLLMGDVQNIKGDTFTLLFKIAGVLYFMDNGPALYGDLLKIMVGFNDTIGTLIHNSAKDAFCVNPIGLASLLDHSAAPHTVTGSAALWDDFDCILMFMLGVGALVAVAGIIAIILLLIFTAGTAIIIVMGILHLVATFFFGVMKFIQVYVMAVMALSFVFVLGFLFVPLLFFKDTFRYFQKWLSLIIGYTLIPLVMYAYMGMVFVVIQETIFSGPNSIMTEFHGTTSNKTGQLTMPDGTAVDPTQPDSNPMGRIQCAKNCVPDSSNTATCPNKYCQASNFSLFRGGVESTTSVAQNDVGALGSSMGNMNTSAHDYEAKGHPFMVETSINYNQIEPTSMAHDQTTTGNPPKTAVQYLIDIAISIAVACLLCYIMFSLISFIPELASSLVSSGTGAGAQVTKAAVFGEAVTMRAIELGQDATGKAVGALKEARSADKLAEKAAGARDKAGAARSKANEAAEKGEKGADKAASKAEKLEGKADKAEAKAETAREKEGGGDQGKAESQQNKKDGDAAVEENTAEKVKDNNDVAEAKTDSDK